MCNAVNTTDQLSNVLGDNETEKSTVPRQQAFRDHLSSGMKAFTLPLNSANKFKIYVSAFKASIHKQDTSPDNI